MNEHPSPRGNNTLAYRLLYGVVGILVIAIVGVVGLIVIQSITSASPDTQTATVLFEQDTRFDGIEVFTPARDVPDFTLTSQINTPLSLSDLAGKPTLLTFGFTNCPDICPLTLNEFKQVREALGDAGDDVNFLFISVDGERDTPSVIADYFRVRRLDDFMFGMTGEEADLRRIGVDYNLKFTYGPVDENGRYNVDHTAGSFLIDANGDYIAKFAFGTDSDIIAEYINAELQATDATDSANNDA